MVTILGIHSYSHIAVAASDWDVRAEAQFEFSKFIKKFQKALEIENPETITDYKKVILQLIPEYRQTIDLLDPLVKVEFCKIATTSPEYPVDCSVLNEALPLPTSVPETTFLSKSMGNSSGPLSKSMGNSSGPCPSPGENNTLTTLEISTLQMRCNSSNDLNIPNLEVNTLPKPYNETNTERAKERLQVGCESLKLLSIETQSILRDMNNSIAKCYKDEN